ncbi:GDSL-type esterase/lipase family protein [Desulfococcus sp.]|uniref:GDSL-type esterase/lipase family protein n=1 Tax=Desulfococcus sp. TaxID=2025834 RepID=UPI0035940903
MNLLAVVGAVAIINKKGGMTWVCRKIDQEIRSQEDETKRLRQLERKKVNHQQLRASIFEQLPISPDDTVFLGDSMLSYGEWHEFFDDNKVKNRAINGDDTHNLLERLPQIIAGKPRHVVILCGINNFHKCIPCKQTTEEFARIVATISSQSQGSDIWLLPIFPVNKALYQKYILPSIPGITMPDQTEVEETNRFLKNLAGDGRPRVHFVDMHAFLNHTGELSGEFTDDGLHLNGRGMKEMAARLQALGL